MDEVDRSRGRFTHPSNVSLRKVWPHLFLLFLLFALVLVPPTNATIVVPLSEEALIDDAVAIVLGHVTSIQGNYDHTRGMIFTNVTVAIEDVFKGELPVGEISVRQLGGSFGDLRSWVVGSPQFTLGEKALLFLRADRHGNPRVAHLYQGKFTVSLDLASSEEFATRETPRGVHAGRGFSPGTSPGPGEKETHRLRDLTDRIRHHLSRIPRRPSQHSAALTLTPGGETGTTVGAFQENFTFMGPARWFESDSGLPVVMKINPSGELLAPTNGFDQTRQALQAWSSVPGSRFRYQDGGFTDAAGFRNDGVNAVSFRDPDDDMDPPVNCSGTLAVGGFSRSDYSQTRTVNGTTFHRILEGDLVVNDGWAGCDYYENFANLAEVATHELGHVLGLGHSSDPNATMHDMAHFDGRGAALRQDDINGLIDIYPAITVTPAADKPSPQPIGTTITFTATASGGTAPQQCKWWLTTDPTWPTSSLLRDWHACTTAVPWTPTVPGTYQVSVWARSSGSTTDAPEVHGANRTLSFTLTPLPVTVTTAPPSPQPVGTALTLTAIVTGGAAPQQCKWFWTTDPNWTTYSVLRTWQACTTAVPWTPTVPGTYQVGVWARNAGTAADVPQGSAGLAYTLTPLPVTATTAPPSPQPVGTALTLTAAVTGGTAPQQCKWLVTTDPTWTTYSVLRTWQACTTAVPWTPTVPGSYQVGVWARNAGTAADVPQGSAGLAYTLTPMTVTVTTAPPSPQPVGTALTLTADVTGGTAPQQCQWFWTTDRTWTTYSILRTWQACTAAVPWTPTVPGSYQVGVWVRSSGSPADAPEASAGLAYNLTPMTVTVTTAPLSPQPVGTALTLTAIVTGGAAPQQCKWFWTTDPTWGTYSVLQSWQACSSPVPWTPASPGTYQVGVWARKAGTAADAPEASAGLAYTLTPPTVTVTTAPLSPQPVGTALTLTAIVTGGAAPQQCKWFWTTDPTWGTYSVLQSWQACSSPVPWTPASPGTYQVGVWARSSGSPADAPEASAGLPVTVTP